MQGTFIELFRGALAALLLIGGANVLCENCRLFFNWNEMNYRGKKIAEFRDKFAAVLVIWKCADIEAFLSETIEECHSFNESKVRGVTGYCVGWNAHHDAVENKFEGKEEG